MSNRVAKILRVVAEAYNKNFRQLKRYYNSLDHKKRGEARDEYYKIAQTVKMNKKIVKAKEKINAISKPKR